MADFYGTVADADTYHLEAGNTAWTGTDDAKTSALVRASQYVDSLALRQRKNGTVYTMFSGVKTDGRTQVLAWPRMGAHDVDGNDLEPDVVPVEVRYATYEAALRELAAPGSLSPDYVPAQLIKREKVDVIDTEFFGLSANVENPLQPVATTVRSLLSPLLVSYGGADVGVMVV